MHLQRIRTISGHTFFPRTLTGNSIVVDLGANRCAFSRAVHDAYGCRCFAVEASPELVAATACTTGVLLFNYAIAGKNGTVHFNISSDPLGSSIREIAHRERVVAVPARTLETLLTENGLNRVDLLKVDIEGAEIDLFDTTPDDVLRRVQITIEFHDFCGLTSPAEVQRIWRRLESLGFSGMRFSASNYNCVFVRRGECGIGSLEWFAMRYGVKYVRGACIRLGLVRTDEQLN